MTQQVQYGVRINLDGNKQAAEGVEQVRTATANLGKTAENAGKQIAAAQQDAITGAAKVAAAQSAATEGFRANEAQIKNVGISAAQMSAALRGVPAQVTDIVTGLSSGQAPLTVLIQQGGQLKDMFGGIGPAVKAIGGYILGLISPLTVAAAAAAVLTYAYSAGSKEAQEYSRAIIMTGNAAGVTSGQLQDMARNVSKTIGTQGAAAAALTEIAGTGRVASENLQRFTQVAIQMERTVGQSVSDTAKDLAALAKAPVEASERLNEKLQYLTSTVYQQIKALQDQGKTDEAAALAQKAYADAFDTRTKQIESNLGTIERGWNSVVSAAKRGWDAILNIGRKDSTNDQVSNVASQIAQTEEKLAKLRNLGSGKDTKIAIATQEAKLNALRLEQSLLQENARLETRAGAAAADNSRQNEARIAWDKESEKYLTRRQLLERELTAERNKGVAAGATEEEIQKRLGDVRKKYADIYNDTIDSQIEAIKRRSQIEDEAAKREIAQIQVRRQIGELNEEQSIQAVAKSELAAIDKRKEALVEELALIKGKQNSLKDQQGIIGQIGKLNSERLSRETQLTNDLTVLESKRARLAAENFANVVGRASDEAEKLRDQVKAQNEYNETIGMTARQAADVEAARMYNIAVIKEEKAALADLVDISGQLGDKYRAQAEELRKLADGKRFGAQKQEWVDVFRSIDSAAHDTFVHIFESGKSAFDRLRDTLKSGLLDLLYQMTVKKWIFSVGASVSGVPGVASAAGESIVGSAATSGAASGLSSALGIASSISSFGGTLATGFMNTLAGTGMSAGLEAAGAMIANGAWAQGLGMAAGALGPVALGVGALVSLANSLDDSGTIHTGGAARASASGASTIDARSLGFMRIDTSADSEKMVSGLASSIVSILDSTAATFGKSAGYTAATAFADDSSKDGAWGALLIEKMGTALVNWDSNRQSRWAPREFGDGEAGRNEYLAALSASVRTALDSIGLPSWAQNMLDALGDSPAIADLATVVDKINATQRALTTMGETLSGFANLTDKAVSALISASGGIDNLYSQAQFFAQNFLTEAEQMAPVIKNVTSQMQALGYAGVNTKEEFADLVKGINLATESGITLYTKLMAIAPQFLQYANYLAKGATDIQTTAKQNLDTIRNDLNEAYNREASAIQNVIDKFASFSSELRDFRANLLQGELSPLSPLKKYQEARDRFDRTYSLAKAGDPTAMGNLTNVAQQFLQASQAVNASSEAYVRDYQKVDAALEAAATAADTQITIARSQLNALNQSVAGILDVNRNVQSVAQLLSSYMAGGGTRAAASAAASSGALGAAGGGADWSNNSAYSHPSGVSASDSESALLTAAKLVYQSATGGVSTAQFNAAAAAVGGDIYAATGWNGDPASFRAQWGFAKGGVFTNGIVTQPTYFDMAEMGEGGNPEAIMPLVRTNDGLAVRSVGGGGAGVETAAAIDRQTAAIERSIEAMERMMTVIAEGQMQSSDDLRTHLQHVSHIMTRTKVAA